MTKEERQMMTEKGKIKEPVRLSTKVSADTNRWLEGKAYEMGLNKSALMTFAIEQFKNQSEAFNVINDEGKMEAKVIEKLKELGIKVEN